MIYGAPLVKRESDVTDRIGVRTLVLALIWQPSSSTLTQAEIDDETPDLPGGMPGGLLWIGQQTMPFGGCYKTRWTFEGINGDGKSVTFATRGNSYDYAFEPGFSQLPISQHPLFWTELLPNFSGSPDPQGDGVLWRPYLSGPVSGGTGLPGSGAGAASQTPNPMFAHQDYFSMEGTYSYRYASLNPPTAYNPVGIACSTAALPGLPPQIPDRDWLPLAPRSKRRGLIFDCLESYWLSIEGKWCPPIYNGTGTTGGSGKGGGVQGPNQNNGTPYNLNPFG